MKNYDWIEHVKGTSKFADDLPVVEGTLHAGVFTSPTAKGKITSLNIAEAISHPGIKAVFTAKDIPGKNQIGAIIADEPLLADEDLHYVGQPIALIVGVEEYSIKQALRKIKIEFEEQKPILDAREAFEKKELIIPPQIFAIGDIDNAWDKCDLIIEGTADTGAQEHLYLETQIAYSIPKEGGGIKLISSTQSPTAVQRCVSRILNLDMHKIEVDVQRLGGGFGGKEDQATAWAAMAALACNLLNQPIKLKLSRQEDMRYTGKRHPYSSDFKIGLKTDGTIIAYKVDFFQNAGAAADLSTAILDRTLFHCTNSYYIPNVKATAYSCRTNLPPNTAFRGFGGPQGMFVIEAAIHKAALKLNLQPFEIQAKNLLKENDKFPYGQKAINCVARKTWSSAVDKFQLAKKINYINEYNSINALSKKGIALMPICFGISFTNKMLNQASALVHIYTDGSVGISTAAIEMGQGVNMKLRQVASRIFSVDISKIKIETTNTTRIANTSPTAASSGADLNGKALEKTCLILRERLLKAAEELLKTGSNEELSLNNENIAVNGIKSNLAWDKLISFAYTNRIPLSAHAHYATPGIDFDRSAAKGNPFSYHVYGTAIIETTVDCLRGIYEINSIETIHDFGHSMNHIVDRSQAEGAIIQGLGWVTLEEIKHSSNGRLLSDSLSTYKVPDIHFTPDKVSVEFLENDFASEAIFNSKAVGEPPFMYSIGAYFALINAIMEFNPHIKIKYDSPLTPEKALLMLYEGKELNFSTPRNK